MSKQDINFYQVDETIIKGLAPLLIKILEEKKRAIIFCENKEQLKEIDINLWSYNRNRFIPHATIFDDKEFDLKTQPIIITINEENINNADYLVFLSDLSEDFVKNFSRVFYFFEERHFSSAQNLAKKIKPSNSYKKEDAKWVKFNF